MHHLAERMAASFEDELKKIAAAKPPTGGGSNALPLIAAGAVGWEGLRRANRDRKMGKMMRIQQDPSTMF